ncbi:MAG: HNH endonuclease [Gemmatimonadaceae bacterium]|nr:HNH endonuclease [Gemmatimonadaceae bacterium]
MRKAFVGITDSEWFEFLANRPELTEVNFWQPGGKVLFSALAPGDLFLFKLHSPNNYIVGGGFFETASLLPVSIAWETFGPMNGVASLEELRRKVERFRRTASPSNEDYTIGNIVLQNVFFFHRTAWIPSPRDFSLNIVQGKGYDLDTGTGRELAAALEVSLNGGQLVSTQRTVAEGMVSRMFSDPVLGRRRLGQGGFRIRVTDTYERQCAVSGEHTLPVLEAAHIKPVSRGGEHKISNGLLLRSDIHTLFDRGYVTITPDLRFRVSGRLNEDWQNGKVYYALDQRPIRLPTDAACSPDREMLEWHGQSVFLR